MDSPVRLLKERNMTPTRTIATTVDYGYEDPNDGVMLRGRIGLMVR